MFFQPYGSISPQCRPQLLSDRIENLIHNIFRNENSTLEINVSLFGVLHHDNYNRFTYLIPQKDVAFVISMLLGYAK